MGELQGISESDLVKVKQGKTELQNWKKKPNREFLWFVCHSSEVKWAIMYLTFFPLLWSFPHVTSDGFKNLPPENWHLWVLSLMIWLWFLVVRQWLFFPQWWIQKLLPNKSAVIFYLVCWLRFLTVEVAKALGGLAWGPLSKLQYCEVLWVYIRSAKDK